MELCACWLAGPAALGVVVPLTDFGGLVLGHHLHVTIHIGLAPASESGQKRGCQKQPRKLILSPSGTSSQTQIIPMFAFVFSVSLLDFLNSN